jgi:phenylpyruvate tautomerase PptA (4-oxalocrotonate tautomerase family)
VVVVQVLWAVTRRELVSAVTVALAQLLQAPRTPVVVAVRRLLAQTTVEQVEVAAAVEDAVTL